MLLQEGHQLFGEVDFAIVSPSGRVLLIEQKSGFLAEGENGLTKAYGDVARTIAKPVARSVRVAVGGVETTAFTVDVATGRVTLASAACELVVDDVYRRTSIG